MVKENIIFGGGGNKCSSLVMWSNPPDGAKPLTVSQFPMGFSVYALAISPNGTRIAAGTRTKTPGTAKVGLFRVFALADYRASENAMPLLEMCHPPAVFGLAFCTDDLVASGGNDGKVKLWSISENRQLGEISAHPNGVFALRQIGSLVLASIGNDGILRIWDLDSLEAKYESEPFDLPKFHALTNLDYNPITGLLIHGSRTGDLHVYDVRNNFEKKIIPAHRGNLAAVAYGSNYVVTAGIEDAMIKLWSGSLDRLITETSTSAGTLAVGWAGADAIITASADNSGQIWKVDNKGLVSGPKFAGLYLRSTVGLPVTITTKCRTEENRRWRDEKIAEAKQFMGQPEKQRELAVIIEELCQRDFSAEAALILADAAKTQGRLLWELDSRLALAEGLENNEAALPSLYALGSLLQEIKEPQLALHYLGKIQQIDKDYRDVEQRINHLKSDPLPQLSSNKDVRGDLMGKELVLRELDKHTILKKKFSWRLILATGDLVQSDAHLDWEQVSQSILETMTEYGADMSSSGLKTVTLLQNGELRDIIWVYVPSATVNLAIAFALEVRDTTAGSGFVPYKVFDPILLGIQPSISAEAHNQQVKTAWMKLANSSEAEKWLTDICSLVMEKLGELESEAMIEDDKF